MNESLAERRRWWRIARITIIAIVLYAVIRVLPTGTNLGHMDFRVQGENTLEMCDPANPQFLPVVNVRSPVRLRLQTQVAPTAGRDVEVILTLATSGGKPITTADLLMVHTRLLHLMIIDPQLMDYHHVHPIPTSEPGQWSFRFKPQYGGEYRFFADFTPAATGLGLYANAKLDVTGEPPSPEKIATAHQPAWTQASGAFQFTIDPSDGRVLADEEARLQLAITHRDGGEVPLHLVMDSYAHVVAFDEKRMGFAHLHPEENNLQHAPDPITPELSFRVTIPQRGRYVLWAQVNMDETEMFVPFWFEVE